MAFLSTTQLLIQAMESIPGTGITNIHNVGTSERVRELEFSIEVAKDDEASKYLTGDYSGNDESIIGMKTGTASYSVKVAPGEFATVSSGVYSHTLTYKDYLANAGLAVVEVGTGASDATPGTYNFYPSASKSSATATVARISRDTDTVAPSSGYLVEKLVGAMSNLTLSVDGVGAPFKLAFETMGAVDSVYEVVSVSGFIESGVNRTVADNFLSTTVKLTDLATLAEYSFCINALTFETGNEITPIECQSSVSGIRNYIITGMNPTLEIDPLLQTLAQFNYWTGFTTEKFYKVEITSAFVSLMIPRAQILNSSVADANDFLRNSLSMRALRNIDSVVPAGLTADANTPQAMYFLSIGESLADY
jgi:hypothetical protein